ncbi:MAG TPA: hypothetical protein VFN56_00845 [Candidatus Saccharimonadales bacterium]|nr:hypothetical protein [Candidatus Saccharimonadales bacterium]
MPTRSTPEPIPDDTFEQAYQAQQALTETQPVDRGFFLESTENLEQTGLQLFGSGDLKPARFAEVMHSVFSKIADVEVEPPLSEEQLKTIAGKVATYSALREASTPKGRRATKKATDTNAIPTDNSKK